MSFDPIRFEGLQRERKLGLGEPLVYHSVTGSTNDDALAEARAGAAHGTTFVADLQTAGRGRRQAAWLSPAGENLLFSVLLRPAIATPRLSGLPLVTGLAVRDAVAPLIAASPLVKWPNDILVDDKKLCGILVESQIRGAEGVAVVIGIGLNVATREFPPELGGRATSLALLGAAPRSREELLVDVLEALERRIAAYEHDGLAGIHAELSAADALRGRAVRVDELRGVARGIDVEGRLLVEDASGATHALLAGTVELC